MFYHFQSKPNQGNSALLDNFGPIMCIIRTVLSRLEGELRGQEHLLPLHRTICSQHHIEQFTMACTSSSKGSDSCLWLSACLQTGGTQTDKKAYKYAHRKFKLKKKFKNHYTLPYSWHGAEQQIPLQDIGLCCRRNYS